MTLFKTFSFYFALLGFVMAALFLKLTEQPKQPVSYIQSPPVTPFAHYIAATGIVESVDKNIEVGSPEEGIVKKMWHHVGDRVDKGDPLFQLDTSKLEAQLLVQQANKAVEEAALEKQKNKLERLQSIGDPLSKTYSNLVKID